MALGGLIFWKLFDEFSIYALARQVRRQGQTKMFMNCHILHNSIVQNQRGVQRLDVYWFLDNRVPFFPIGPEYQLGPDSV